MKTVSRNESETFDLGYNLGKNLGGGSTVLLSGFLGAGKTVFCKGVGKALGVGGDMLSPTFPLMCAYKTENGLTLCHIDAYRLKNASEAEEAGIAEVVGASDTVALIEWHENIAALLAGREAVKVEIRVLGESEREITIT